LGRGVAPPGEAGLLGYEPVEYGSLADAAIGKFIEHRSCGCDKVLIGGRIQISDWKDRIDRIAIQERAGFNDCPGACTFDRAQMQLCFMQKSY
jgi:hypothetical protein